MQTEQVFTEGDHKAVGKNWVRNSAKLHAYAGDTIAQDDSTVTAYGDATVYAYDNSTVFASEWTRVIVPTGAPEVFAKGYSTVHIGNGAKPKVMLAGAAVSIDHNTYPATIKSAVKTDDPTSFDSNWTEGRERGNHRSITGNTGREVNRRSPRNASRDGNGTRREVTS